MFYIPKTMPNGMSYETTFHMDFDIAEHFGLNAVKDTFKRAFKEWKNEIEYVTELAIVMNGRCWYWYANGRKDLADYYGEMYYKVRDSVYTNKKFTKEDLNYYFRLTD